MTPFGNGVTGTWPFALRSSNAVKDEYRGLLTAHSRYMGDKRDSRIRIEGVERLKKDQEYTIDDLIVLERLFAATPRGAALVAGGLPYLEQVVEATKVPIVSAGSIASFERINEVWGAGAWGFTIGSAFFDKKFVPQGSFEENVLAVCSWLGEQ